MKLAIDRGPGSYNAKSDAKKWVIVKKHAEQNSEVARTVLDRPGMQKVPRNARSGGGFTSLASGTSRRRILQFDLGFAGRAPRFKPPQILETVDGCVTISKFIKLALPAEFLTNIPEPYLRYWRQQFAQYGGNQNHEPEPTTTVVHWNESAEALLEYEAL